MSESDGDDDDCNDGHDVHEDSDTNGEEASQILAGDGRHDSIEHSTKYCAYSMFCCSDPVNAIVDFSLVQVQC